MESTARRTAEPFRINTFLEPDVLTSFEYSTTIQRRDHLLPEMRLMFAVLTNAIESLQKYAGAKSRRCRKIFQEAEAWIFGGNGQSLYSFEHVCEALQLDSSYLRKGLMRWRGALPSTRGNGPQRRIREPLRYRRRLRDPRISV
jgi:hypothetical protein